VTLGTRRIVDVPSGAPLCISVSILRQHLLQRNALYPVKLTRVTFSDEMDVVVRQARQRHAGEAHHIRCVHVDIGRRALIICANIHEVNVSDVDRLLDGSTNFGACIEVAETGKIFTSSAAWESGST
jgi:hypothetical protein